MAQTDVPYELYYWPGIQGRGELIRLAFEETRTPYVDVARRPSQEGGGVAALERVLSAAGGIRPFAPPILKVGDLVLAQTAAILAWLAPRIGLAPEKEGDRLAAHQHQLTVADLYTEVHDTHHPIGVELYYEDQRAEARRSAEHFLSERLPKFLGYFEDLLRRNSRSTGQYLAGDRLSYVDLSLFQMLTGLTYAFPRAMRRLAPQIPLSMALRDHVAARRHIAVYLASPRRVPFSEDDIFRHYDELDDAAIELPPAGE